MMCTRTLEIRAAVSLNNTGIALVQRGNFRQGLKILNHAVTVMKLAFDPLNPFRFDAALSHAAQCVAQPTAEGVYSGGLTIGIQTDDHSSSCYDLVDHHNYDVCMMRITEEAATWNYDLPATTSSANDLLSAITILNFGLSYRCMGSITTDEEGKCALLAGSGRLLRLAHTILSNLFESDHLDTEKLDHTEMRAIITAALLVLKNLVQISTLLGDGESRQEFSNRLKHLSDFARHYFQQADELGVGAAASAA